MGVKNDMAQMATVVSDALMEPLWENLFTLGLSKQIRAVPPLYHHHSLQNAHSLWPSWSSELNLLKPKKNYFS